MSDKSPLPISEMELKLTVLLPLPSVTMGKQGPESEQNRKTRWITDPGKRTGHNVVPGPTKADAGVIKVGDVVVRDGVVEATV